MAKPDLENMKAICNRVLLARVGPDDFEEWSAADDKFADAFTPEVILKLIDRVEKAEG
jgi:hypothetical protein